MRYLINKSNNQMTCYDETRITIIVAIILAKWNLLIDNIIECIKTPNNKLRDINQLKSFDIKKNMNKITKEKFEQYESIRQSGITNMFDILQVTVLSDDLTRLEVLEIIKNYTKYESKYKKE